MDLEQNEYKRQEITSKENAIEALEKLHIKIYSRLKGKGLGLIEKISNDSEDLTTNKELFISYLTSISNDISNTIKNSLQFLK